MSVPAILMMVFGLTVTWGGSAVCFIISIKAKKRS